MRKEVGIVAPLPLGVVALEMITVGGVLHLGEDLQEGEASLEAGAGHFLEIGEERGLCLVRETTSRLDLSLGLVADLGQMKGSKKTSLQKKWCTGSNFIQTRLHKLGAFLRCFSCSCSLKQN